MRLFGPYSWTLVFPSLFLHCFKSTSLPPLLPHSTLFNLLSFHSTLPNGSFMFIPYFSTISPPIIPIHVRPFRSFSFFLFVYRDLLPFHHLHSKFYPLFLPCSSCSFSTPPPSFPLSLFFTPYQAQPTPLDLSYPFVQLFLRDKSLVLLLAFIRRFPGSARPPPLHHRFPRYVPRASALPLPSRSTPRCRVQAKKARFALSLELSASTEARTGEASGNERSCEVRGGGFRERLFHPLPSHSYLSRYKQKRTTSPLFCECSTSSSESSSVEH